jgi:hypothetical protein
MCFACMVGGWSNPLRRFYGQQRSGVDGHFIGAACRAVFFCRYCSFRRPLCSELLDVQQRRSDPNFTLEGLSTRRFVFAHRLFCIQHFPKSDEFEIGP